MNTESERILREHPVADVTVEQVMKVYSGKPGCGCGCRGTYRVNPLHLQTANKERGYDYELSEVNITQVRRVLQLIKEGFNGVGEGVQATETKTLRIYSLENSERYYWAYVIKN